jgi:hypothetical protein
MGSAVGQLIERVNVWIQIFTSVSVIAGFGLVVWQLQLTRQTAIDQYALFNVSDDSADSSSVYGENAAEVLAKACLTPDEMSDTDLIILQHYFSNKVYRMFVAFWQSEFRGDENWKNIASHYLSTILMYPQGAGFFRGFSFPDPNSSPLKLFVEEQLAIGDTKTCREVLGRMRLNR